MGILKDLHLCGTFSELQNRSSLPEKFRSTIAPCEKLAQSIAKMYDHASLSEKEGDEEEAYILYMRCSELVSKVLPKSRNFDKCKQQKHECLKRSLKLGMEAMERSENLARSLTKRYELYEEMGRVDDAPSVQGLPTPPREASGTPPDPQPEVPLDSVDAIKLEEWSTDPSKTILLLDFRKSKASHILTEKLRRLTILDVPFEAVVPGLTMKTLESNLSVKDRNSLRKISEADFVVLLDERGDGGEKRGTPGKILLDAIFEYNQDRRLKLRRKPLFLKGGFESWGLHYPSYTSKPQNGTTNALESLRLPVDLTPDVSTVEYPDLEKFFKKAVAPKNEVADIQDPTPPNIPQIPQPHVPVPTPHPEPPMKKILPSIPDRTLKPGNPPATVHPPPPPEPIPAPIIEPSAGPDHFPDLNNEPDPKITTEPPKLEPAPTRNLPKFDRSTKPTLNGSSHSEQIVEPNYQPNTDPQEPSSNPSEGTVEQTKNMPTVPRDTKPKNNVESTPSEIMTKGSNSVSSEKPGAEKPSRTAQSLPNVDRSRKPIQKALVPTERQLSVDKAYLSKAYGWMMKTVEGRKQAGQGLTGLRNQGNTCFMNSILQILGKTKPLTDFFLDREYVAHLNLENTLGSHGVVASSFAAVLLLLWEGHRVISPGYFLEAIGNSIDFFCDGRQHDAQEFCLSVIDLLHEDLNQVRRRISMPEQKNDPNQMKHSYELYYNHLQNFGRSRIYDIFQGTMVSTMQCKVCSYTSVTFEPFTQITLELPSRRSATLQSCLERHLEAEELSGDSQWNCPRCRRRQDAYKQLKFWKLPPVMIIHLKRFGAGGYFKLETDVSFPQERMDMRQHLHPQSDGTLSNFQLYGLTNHFGSLEGGHYNAVCRHPNGKWYTHDDEMLRAVTDIKVH